MKYPDKKFTVAVMFEAARLAVANSSSEHPEDIATTMCNAIDVTASIMPFVHSYYEKA